MGRLGLERDFARGGEGIVKEKLELPRMIYAAEIADLLGWGTDKSAVQRARRWMKRHGLMDRDGRRFFATAERLQVVFPREYNDAVEQLVK
jgi:hypothetical protein